tara:strand:- start:2020 stop:2343 length:324 start_codon:yes stop_codon:yes gene_type:complete
MAVTSVAVVFDNRTSTFGDRVLITGTYEASDAGSIINLESLGLKRIFGVVHMGDSQTNIALKTAGNVNISNFITVRNSVGSRSMTINTPINSVANGGGKFMIIGRRS